MDIKDDLKFVKNWVHYLWRPKLNKDGEPVEEISFEPPLNQATWKFLEEHLTEADFYNLVLTLKDKIVGIAPEIREDLEKQEADRDKEIPQEFKPDERDKV